MITSDRIGRGDEELGRKLMENFLRTLPEMEGLWRLILINSGVRLAIRDSGLLEPLRELETSGVSILVCGTCLSHFRLLEDKAIGETTNMLDVVTSLQLAGKVITI
jgi:selenium metabolism protein YedF